MKRFFANLGYILISLVINIIISISTVSDNIRNILWSNNFKSEVTVLFIIWILITIFQIILGIYLDEKHFKEN